MDSFQKFYGFSKEQAWKAVEFYREYYKDKGIFENRLYDGIKMVVKKLKEDGKTLVVTTSKPEPFAREIMKYFYLESYFDYIAGMELNGGRGTKAEVIQYAMETCHIVEQSKILMIGDRKYDVIGAKKAGIDSLGVLYGFGTRKELEQAGADYIIEQAEEILQFC